MSSFSLKTLGSNRLRQRIVAAQDVTRAQTTSLPFF